MKCFLRALKHNLTVIPLKLFFWWLFDGGLHFDDGHLYQVDGHINGAYPDDLRLRCMTCMDCGKELIEIDN